MPPEPLVQPYLRIVSETSCRFTGTLGDLRRCAAAVLLGTVAYMNGRMSLEASAGMMAIGSRYWEAIEVFGDSVLFSSEAEYMLVRIDGAADQHCRCITFAARYDDPSNDGDSPEDVLRRHQSAVALERLITADM